jgi:hypothetical protein
VEIPRTWKGHERRRKLFGSYDRGIITANELFPALLDSFCGGGIREQLEATEEDLRERIDHFLASHLPATFRPFLIGPGPTPAEAVKWEQERRQNYAELLDALGIANPGPAIEWALKSKRDIRALACYADGK